MTVEEQLAAWLEGNSFHNNDRDECCPDFSCCDPELLADKKTRQAFVNADEALRWSFLAMFLGKMLKKEKKSSRIYIAGDVQGNLH